MSEFNHEMISRYLEGELSGEELYAFEQQLQQDPALAEEVALYKKINEEMQQQVLLEKDTEQLAANLARLNKEFFREEKTVKPVRKINRWWYAAAGAAAAVLLLFLFNPFSGKESFDNNKLFAYYTSKVEELPGNQRGDANDSLLQEAAVFYNKQDYKNALPLLQAVAVSRPEDMQVQLALGISMVQEGKYADANRVLESIEKGNSIFRSEATWYKAMALLKQNNTTACYEVLKTIPGTSSRYKQAAELMKKIDKSGKR